MIYITFFYPYLLILYCIKNVNKNVFGNNKILINNKPHIDCELIKLRKKKNK